MIFIGKYYILYKKIQINKIKLIIIKLILYKYNIHIIRMIILSIDVGIKNLAVCCFNIDLQDKTYNLIDWKVYNLCEDSIKYCSCKKNNGKLCNKKAKYIKYDIYCCKTHANISDYCIPTSEMNISNLKKKRVSELYSIAKKYNIKHDEKILKNKLLDLFQDHISNNYFDIIVPVKIDDVHMLTIGKNITTIFNNNYENLNIDAVLIENQISPIANKMKTIQGMIAQYFIMTSISEILFVSSINKLKHYKDCQRLSYNERKKKSIEICRNNLIETNSSYLQYFDKSNKKDDLSDSYLQGLWYIRDKIFM